MKNIIVGVTGASGSCIAASILEMLHDVPEMHSILVMTDSARVTASLEYPPGAEHLEELADEVLDVHDIAASVSSGTFRTEGMIIVPCSMKTVAGIVSGYSDNLLLRAADVVLKERRKLVVVPREAPLSVIHCRNLLALSELGAIVVPPVMSFYNNPESIDDMVRHIAFKVLDCFGFELPEMKRWYPET